jgi:hypothetical protein
MSRSVRSRLRALGRCRVLISYVGARLDGEIRRPSDTSQILLTRNIKWRLLVSNIKRARDGLIKFWRGYNPHKTPYGEAHFHHLDEPALAYDKRFLAARSAGFPRFEPTEDRWFGIGKPEFAWELPPSPYCGDIEKCKVLLFIGNPGYSPGDTIVHRHSKEFCEHHWRTLYQTGLDSDFPFFVLNPKFAHTPAFIWWENRLRGQITYLQSNGRKRYSYFEALSRVARSIAVVEFIPYPSVSRTGSKKAISNLVSVQLARSFAIASARESNQTLIVRRAAKDWKLYGIENPNLFIAPPSQGLWLGPKSEVGKRIASALIAAE